MTPGADNSPQEDYATAKVLLGRFRLYLAYRHPDHLFFVFLFIYLPPLSHPRWTPFSLFRRNPRRPAKPEARHAPRVVHPRRRRREVSPAHNRMCPCCPLPGLVQEIVQYARAEGRDASSVAASREGS